LEDLSYFIDLGRLQESGRSFIVIVRHCLCPTCQKRLASESKAVDAASLIMNVRDCCSKAHAFVSPRLPLLEKVFRLFLSKGNEALSLDELITELTPYSDNPAPLSPQTLKCLLENDQYYGFGQKHTRGK
jgi:hypothetical protein